MTYVMSDIHGEYELFLKLMKKIKLTRNDELYICGDIIEKGRGSVKLSRLLFSLPGVHIIMGNHEDSFLQFYNHAMRENDGDYGKVLTELKAYLNQSGDGDLLDWEVVDALEGLPYYIETDDFICIHAGVSLTPEGEIPPLKTVPVEELVASRRFKNPDVIPKNSKCVFFGHTATSAVCSEHKIIAYKRADTAFGDIRDYVKVHLDTCTMVSGILGCFCVETCRAYYVKRGEEGYESELCIFKV